MSEAAFELPEEADRMPLPRDPPPPPGYVDPLEANPALADVSIPVSDEGSGPDVHRRRPVEGERGLS